MRYWLMKSEPGEFSIDDLAAAPRWLNVDVKLMRKTPLVGLAELRRHRELAGMRLLARGNRLSITPVEPKEWEFITRRLVKP